MLGCACTHLPEQEGQANVAKGYEGNKTDLLLAAAAAIATRLRRAAWREVPRIRRGNILTAVAGTTAVAISSRPVVLLSCRNLIASRTFPHRDHPGVRKPIARANRT